MQGISLLSFRPTYLLVAVVAALAVAASGCSGPAATSSQAETSTPDSVLAQLPAPGEITRQGAMIANALMCPGSEYQHSFPSLNVTDMGSVAVYSPQWGGTFALPQAAFAIYQYRESDLDFLATSARVLLRGMQPGPPQGTRIFAALGWGGAWHWSELLPETNDTDSWSWACSPQWGGFRPGQAGELVPAVIVMFGDGSVKVSEIDIIPDDTSMAAGPVVFRKGWDGTIKGRTAFDGSVHVVGDNQGALSASFYDSSNGQLYYLHMRDRINTLEAVDCDGDVGLFNDLALTPTGGLLLPYYDADLKQGAVKELPFIEDLVWSPRSNFDTGDDGSGLPPVDVGQHCSLVFDPQGTPHMFYNDLDNGRIKHAWQPVGAMTWLNEYVSPVGEDASMPVGMSGAAGVSCAFIVNSHTGPFDLVVAQPGPIGWTEDLLADDVANPLGAASSVAGFCDGSVRPGTDEAVIAYSFTGGVKIIHRDLATRSTLETKVGDGTPGAGAFIHLAMLADGSTVSSSYNPTTRMIAIIRESPTLPAIQLPAVQFGPGEDCDDQDIWVSPEDLDGDGMLDLALFTLSSSASISGNGRRKEFTGHVTLIK